MALPYVGEIRMFGGNFAPAGWMFCDGQLLPISEQETLFNLIGTTYGGDGESTFALPDLRGRAPLHQGPGHALAQAAGVEEVTLNRTQIPTHNHQVIAAGVTGTSSSAQGNVWAGGTDTPYAVLDPQSPDLVQLAPGSLGPSGGSQPHSNMPPYLAVSFIISLFGIFPAQN
ncbi:Microcystin-dependent protein [Microterricola viridarii]|uniref:Microcystin-dependent protein n=2 Tax=Microterricola viridarii TaxID=412690 RepID=A0A1H1LE89_9MICO|nr:Microcystin-dependent protein [Microterricola viridarii]